jgi:hypothetical protein
MLQGTLALTLKTGTGSLTPGITPHRQISGDPAVQTARFFSLLKLEQEGHVASGGSSNNRGRSTTA